MVNSASTSSLSGSRMVEVPGAAFFMGSDSGSEFERPVHEVLIERFWMDAHLVSNRDFETFARATGHFTDAELRGEAWGHRDGTFGIIPGLSWRTYATPERQDHPVVLVSWYDAAAYANWCGKALPTEAEWERAARGGAIGAEYPWGRTGPNDAQCNFARPAGDVLPTTPVRTFAPNAFGIFDLVGNVWQWCHDWYGADYYAHSEAKNPTGPAVGADKVRRGGAWNVIQSFRLRTANRGALQPAQAAINTGFRCVVRDKSRSLRVVSERRALELDAPRHTVPSATASAALLEVREALEALRPAMRADGGDVEVSRVEAGVVTVRLLGTCRSCPSSELTLTRGIEPALRGRLPWLVSVVRES